jgi:hypothetical protein
MPTTLDFQMFSDKDFIGYIPVMDNQKAPVPIGDGIFARQFIIMEDGDCCTCFIAPSTALSVSYSDDSESDVDVKVVNIDSEETEYDETMPVEEWTSKMKDIVTSFQK